MSKARQAAIGRRKIWEGHDYFDDDHYSDKGAEDTIREGAIELYSVLTDADEESLEMAGEMIKDAFWLADKAEAYQDEDPEEEDRIYNQSARLLKEARNQVGLDWRPMEYRGNGWWKYYRHGDLESVLETLFKEHLTEFGKHSEDDAQKATELLVDAGVTGHDQDDWDYVDDRLEGYYKIALHYLN